MARPLLVNPWGPLLEEPLALRQHLLAQEQEQDQAPGQPASSLEVAVLACFKPQKVYLPLPSILTWAYRFPAEALDQWFENLQNYEATLVRLTQFSTETSFNPLIQEDMAAASLDVNFKEELSAIEQCKITLWDIVGLC